MSCWRPSVSSLSDKNLQGQPVIRKPWLCNTFYHLVLTVNIRHKSPVLPIGEEEKKNILKYARAFCISVPNNICPQEKLDNQSLKFWDFTSLTDLGEGKYLNPASPSLPVLSKGGGKINLGSSNPEANVH